MLYDMFQVFGNLRMIKLYFVYLSQTITTISFPLLLLAIRMDSLLFSLPSLFLLCVVIKFWPCIFSRVK